MFLPFFFLLFLLFSPFIIIEDKGPIFFISRRIGKNKKVFNMIKFRTMKTNAPDIRNIDGSTFNSTVDSRVLRIGKLMRKYSLDEIPQIFNIFLGEMSFIGPRPDLADQISLYDKDSEIKFYIRPGLSGYAQVKGRNQITFKEKNNFDNYYVQNLSLKLDLFILFLTIRKVLYAEGVNQRWKLLLSV